MKAAVLSRNIGISGTPSIRINVAAADVASACGSAKVPVGAWISIIGTGWSS